MIIKIATYRLIIKTATLQGGNKNSKIQVNKNSNIQGDSKKSKIQDDENTAKYRVLMKAKFLVMLWDVNMIHTGTI